MFAATQVIAEERGGRIMASMGWLLLVVLVMLQLLRLVIGFCVTSAVGKDTVLPGG